jgi:hypothetical protein
MAITISLRKVVEELEAVNDAFRAYLQKETGEIVSVALENLGHAEEGDALEDFPDWQQAAIEEARQVLSTDKYLPLPDAFEIHEYSIMEDFCYSVEDEKRRNLLLDKIRGRGAFGRFKDAIHQLGIAEAWYQFRDSALKDIAIDWLEAHSIAYTDDMADRKRRG